MRTFKTCFALFFFFFACISHTQAGEKIQKLPLPSNAASSFEQAKKNLYEKVYKNPADRKTFYCGCTYNDKNEVDLKSCGYKVRKNEDRAKRIEAEHVFPAYQFGNFLACWREPEKICSEGVTGRACCNKTEPKFEMAHNDLHNLFPAIGEVNGDRSNYNWGMIPDSKQAVYGKCEMKIDSSINRAEPPNRVKGDIARVYFYMAATYGFNLSRQDRQLFTAWDKQDPVDAWEIERNKRIAAIQGNLNPFISDDSKELDDTEKETTNPPPIPKPTKEEKPSKAEFSCDTKKTCGQMSSCEEAKYHLLTCKNTSLDKDGDGVPCQSVCKD